jgi:RES domain-containing protein
MHVGNRDDGPCDNCSSQNGVGLDEDGLAKLATRFFIDGSRQPYLPPVYRIDYSQVGKQNDPVSFDETLQCDYELIASHLETLRYHAPRLRIMGYGGPFWDFTEALKSFDEKSDRTQLAKVANDILNRCSCAFLQPGQAIYRIRTNPQRIWDPQDIDTPPSQGASPSRRSGRFDTPDLPALYACGDVETALHESRVRLGDEIVLGTLEVLAEQKVIDLDVVKEQVIDGYNVNADYHYFLRGRVGSQHPADYRMLQVLALEARASGLAGVKFNSFYSTLRQDYRKAVNYALFGYPIREGKLRLKSWNTVRLLKASYDFQFGPLPHTLWEEKS